MEKLELSCIAGGIYKTGVATTKNNSVVPQKANHRIMTQV